MSDEQTLTGYLGSEFQLKLLYELCTDVEFAEKTIPLIEISYFDNSTYKRFFSILNEYFKKYEKPANLNNRSIGMAIKKFTRRSKKEEVDMLMGVGQSIKNWNDGIVNRKFRHDGDVVQKEAIRFIKQQEYRKIADFIDKGVKDGDNSDEFLYAIEEKIDKVGRIGMDDDMGIEVMENYKRALQPDFRKTIPTGIKGIDAVTEGGLGKGEIGIVLAPSGVGKSTILSYFANTAYNLGYNVLQIIFEDKEDDIRRKHFCKWTKIPLSQISERSEEVDRKLREWHEKNPQHGNLIIKKFPQEDTTIPKVKQYIDSYQKKNGIKFDIVVLDYLDEIETHKRATDTNNAELQVIKAFEAMADEYDIPCWTAIQGNRSSFNAEKVGHSQMGGNIKRAQKTHFLMSIAKTDDQKEADQANIQILKARFAKDGHIFRDCIFNNGTMEISITDELPPHLLKRLDDKVTKSTLEKIENMSMAISENEETDNYGVDDTIKKNETSNEKEYDEYDGVFDLDDNNDVLDDNNEDVGEFDVIKKKEYDINVEDDVNPIHKYNEENDIQTRNYVNAIYDNNENNEEKPIISDINEIDKLLKQRKNEIFNDTS